MTGLEPVALALQVRVLQGVLKKNNMKIIRKLIDNPNYFT